jgi:glycogen synthase
MKILMVSNLYPPYYVGGYELRCALAAEELHHRGHNVKVLTSRFGVSFRGSVQENIRGVMVERVLCQYLIGPQPPLGWPIRLLRKYVNRQKYQTVHKTIDGLISVRPQLQDLRHFIRVVDEFKPDVINWWSIRGLSKGILPVPKLKGIPDMFCVEDDWVIEEQSLSEASKGPRWADLWCEPWGRTRTDPGREEDRSRHWRLFAIWLLEMWKASLLKEGLVTSYVPFCPSYVCFVSEFMRADYEAAGLRFPSSEVIYGGVPTDKFYFRRGAPAEDRDPTWLLYAGQISRDRGLHTAIEAVASLSPEARSLVTLTVVGDFFEPEYMEEIRDQVRARQLTEKVVFVGRKSYEQMPQIYRCHDLLIAPSLRKEGLPLSMVEAMLSGCAVVTTGSGGAMEIARLANLPLFPQGDAVALGQVLERLISDRRRLQQIAREGQEVALREFSSDRMVDRFCATFQKLCGQQKRRKNRAKPNVQTSREAQSVAHGRSMKILNISPMYFPVSRGGERHVQEVSERLAARGHQVTVLTTSVMSGHELERGIDGALEEVESINGVRVVRVPATDGALPTIIRSGLRLKGGYRSLSHFFTPSGLEVLSRPPRHLGFLRSILRSNADLVVAWNWYWPPAYQAYLAKSLKRFRLVGIPFFHTEDSWVQRPIYDPMIAACDGLVVNSSHEKEFIMERVPGAQRIAVLGAGVDPEPFARRDGGAFRRRCGIDGRPLIGFVGSLASHKNVAKIVDAMPFVWQWNREVCFVIAGFPDGPYPELDRALGRLDPGDRDRVLVMRNIPESEKADLYDALDVFVMPSIGESFGISYLEAWICRKPVIGAKIASTACVIDEEMDGLLVEPKDSRDMARAIIELLADPDRRSRMGAQGYAKTIENFTWERICDGIEKVLVDLMADTPRFHLWPWPLSSRSQVKRLKKPGPTSSRLRMSE